jgi:hypothetical protein
MYRWGVGDSIETVCQLEKSNVAKRRRSSGASELKRNVDAKHRQNLWTSTSSIVNRLSSSPNRMTTHNHHEFPPKTPCPLKTYPQPMPPFLHHNSVPATATGWHNISPGRARTANQQTRQHSTHHALLRRQTPPWADAASTKNWRPDDA